MKLKNMLSLLMQTGLVLCALTQLAFAGSAVSLNIYPESLEIAYGATAQETTLTFYVVSNAPNALALSNYSLAPVTPPTGTNPVTVSGYTDNCNGILPPQGSTGVCTITVNVTAAGNPWGTTSNFIAPINYAFSFNYGTGKRQQTMTSPTFPITFATGQVIPSAARTFTFVNNCSQNVYLGISSGAAPAINPNPSIQPPDPQSCISNADCYAGTQCVQVSTHPVVLKHCLWLNPVPTGGATGYELTTSSPGNTTTVSFPMYDNGINPTWSGGIAARIGCSGAGASCTVADCGGTSGNGACVLGQGFATPNTTAEFTLQGIQPFVTNTSGYPDGDTYDITVINGVTGGGISMAPTNGTWAGTANPYVCGTPGSASATAPLGSCDWATMAPPASPAVGLTADYVWVTSGGTTCPSGTGCVTGTCGHSITGATVNPLSCGTQLGLLTADAVCAIDSTFSAPFNCASTVTENSKTYTYANIYGCAVGDFANSCYSAGANGACCGCQDWASDVNYPAVIPSTTQSCKGINNTNWSSIARPTLSWLKQACPTAYVFPYDDASSTFTCQVLNGNNVNTTNYTITFCPS